MEHIQPLFTFDQLTEGVQDPVAYVVVGSDMRREASIREGSLIIVDMATVGDVKSGDLAAVLYQGQLLLRRLRDLRVRGVGSLYLGSDNGEEEVVSDLQIMGKVVVHVAHHASSTPPWYRMALDSCYA